MKIRDAISLLHFKNGDSLFDDFIDRRIKYKQKIVNVTVFINAKTKLYYDVKHTFFRFNQRNRTYLRLNNNYQLSNKLNKKFSSQKCNFFLVKRQVNRLTYKLKLSFNWKIHSIVFVIQLKLFFKTNSYDRSLPDHFDAIKMKDDTSRWRFYEVEKIVNKRFRKYDNSKIAQYLLKWKDWKSKWNKWRNIIKLNNCLKLIEEYEKRQRIKQRFRNEHQSAFIKERRRRTSTSSNTLFK